MKVDNQPRSRKFRLSVRVIGIFLFWAIPLTSAFIAAELYSRHAGLYRLWSYPLSRIPFSELDRPKIWNKRYFEISARYFREWPAPIELFESETPHPRYLWKPNVRLERRGARLIPAEPGTNAYFSTNSWGFRGPEFSVQKPPDLIRIVCLGASTTGGSQGDLETYPYFLKLELDRLFPNQRFEVINAGHHGTTIDDLFEILKSRVLPLQPDLVIFYESSNNIDWNEFISGTTVACPQEDCWLSQYPGWYRFLYRRSALFSSIADRSHWRRVQPMPHKLSLDQTKPSLVHYGNIMGDIANETLNHGSRIMLTSFITIAHEGMEVSRDENISLFDQIARDLYPFTPGEVRDVYDLFNEQSREVARKFDVPFADLAAEFPKDNRYFPVDYIHFSPEGNRLLAVVLARHVMKDVLTEVIKGRHLNDMQMHH